MYFLLKAIAERTLDLDNVVRTATQISTQIVNDVILPQMERQLGTKVDAMEELMRNEFELKFQAEKEDLVTQTKAELTLEMEQKFNDEKEALRSEMREQLQSELEEKLMNVGEPKIFFQAIHKSGRISNAVITYDEAGVNVGNSFDHNTGIFSAATSGLYFFTFSALTSDSVTGLSQVNILKNGAKFNGIYDSNGNEKFNNLNSSWMMTLQEGDQVKLKVVVGKIHGDSNIKLIWSGQLLKANV